SLPLRANQVEDLAVLGIAAFPLLREDELAVGEDVELAALTRDCARLMPIHSVDRDRETRGPGVVAVSDWAVEDLDPHGVEINVRLWGQAPPSAQTSRTRVGL